MTTSEFIKMLQAEDPSGEAHIRLDGGVPYAAEHKPGYYDGPFTYLDKDGNYVTSTVGTKVDIYCKEPSTLIWDNDMEWNEFTEDPELAWERLKKLFLFEGHDGRKDQVASFFVRLRKEFDEYVAHSTVSNKKYLEDVLDKHAKGWRFMQKKDGRMKFYDWEIRRPDGKNDGANWATTGPILLSGRFEPVDCDGFIEWIPKSI